MGVDSKAGEQVEGLMRGMEEVRGESREGLKGTAEQRTVVTV